MATQAYWDWNASGRTWQLAQPITDMVAVARRHGIAVLGTIGNDDHLMSDWPEDHTPFSRTYWPVPAPGWVCACDLANAQGLGEAILRDARAGLTPWLKYMNFAGLTYSHEDGFRVGYDNADEHVHLSCRSDWLTRSIGGYDPLAPQGVPDMELSDRFVIPVWKDSFQAPESTTVEIALAVAQRRSYEAKTAAQSADRKLDQLLAAAAADATRDAATLAAVQALTVATGADPAPILAAIREAADGVRTAVLTELAKAPSATVGELVRELTD